MLTADVIVLATPVYFYTMCAQLKSLIDRSVMVYPDLTDKEFYFLITMADTAQEMFRGTVVKKDRSLMNIPFVTGDSDLDAKFVKEAEAAGFVNLKGHRTVGGMRASLYNAMPIEGVERLVDFMKKFEER